MSWNANVARLIAFPLPGQVRAANDMWGRAFDTPMQTFMQLPNLPAGSQAVGKVGDETIVLVSQFGRMEITGTPVVPPAPPVAGQAPPAFNDLKAVLDRNLNGALKALADVSVNRLAVVIEASIGAASAEDAAEAMRVELGLDDKWQGATDLSFQLNRRKAAAAGHEMNRVARWATGVNQVVKITVGPPGVAPVNITSVHARTLTLDVNTASPMNAPIPPAQVEPVWKELADEAIALLHDPHARLRRI